MALVCGRDPESEERSATCQIAFDVDGTAVLYHAELQFGQQYLDVGSGSVQIDWDSSEVTISAPVLAVGL